MSSEKNKSSILDRWAADVRSYENGAKPPVSVPQCETCKNIIKGNALHCNVYKDMKKPEDVLFPHKECPSYCAARPIDVSIRNDEDERLYGGLFGFCVGDALGVPVEFSSREERWRDPVKEMRGYGTYHQPFGTWSDDTSMMLCLIDAMTEGYTAEKLAHNFVEFYQNARFTPHGEVFDIGGSTREAIARICAGVSPAACGGRTERDNGNGSLMRILPAAYLGQAYRAEEFIHLTEEISSITHGHKRAVLACIFYTKLADRLIRGDRKEEALDHAIRFLEKNCQSSYADEFGNFGRILHKTVIDAPEEEIWSSGYVIDTLEAVIWAFFKGEDYRSTVLTAINLGGDTDTIAGIAGGLAGICYGFSDIPQNWVQCVARKEELYQMFTRFMDKVRVP